MPSPSEPSPQTRVPGDPTIPQATGVSDIPQSTRDQGLFPVFAVVWLWFAWLVGLGAGDHAMQVLFLSHTFSPLFVL